MATATLRPDGVFINSGIWSNQGGAASIQAALSDNSDTTYAQCQAFPGTGVTLELTMGTVAVPALAQIRSVTPRTREGGGGFTQTYGLRSGGVLANNTRPSGGGATSYTGATLTTRPNDGAAWTQTDIDNLQWIHWSSNLDSATIQLYEAYIDVIYNEAPVVSAISPSGTITTTAQPTVAWAYVDPETDAQERYRVKIYQGTGTVADPDNTAAYYDSGEIFSSATSHALSVALAAGSYRIYAKAADVGSGGRYSAWATQTFTIQVDAPAQPTVTAVADSALARIGVTVQGGDNLLTANQASIESGVTGWEADANVTGSPTNTSAAGSFVNGNAAMAWTASAASSSVRTLAANGSRFGVVAGKTVTAVASLKRAAAGTTRNGRIGVRYYDASNNLIAGTYQGSTVSVTNAAHTQAIYTGTVPAGAVTAVVFLQITDSAATEVFWADAISIAPGTSTTWVAGGRNTASVILVEKSIDGGTTWTTVRGGAAASWDSPANQQLVLYDYEIVRNVSVLYRARITATVGTIVATSPYGQSASVSHAATGWWLKDPLAPGTNIQLDVQPGFSFRRKEPQSIFEPVGRNISVVVTDGVRGIEGSLSVWAKDAARYAKVLDIVDSGHNLWLEDVFGRAWYIHLGEATDWSLLRAQPQISETTPIRHMHSVTLPFVEVGSPAGDVVAAGTPTG